MTNSIFKEGREKSGTRLNHSPEYFFFFLFYFCYTTNKHVGNYYRGDKKLDNFFKIFQKLLKLYIKKKKKTCTKSRY